MILLIILSFLISAISMAWIIRRSRKHAQRYAQDAPQRFHLGHISRLAGAGMLAALSCGWLLIAWRGQYANIVANPSKVLLPLLAIAPAVLCGIREDYTQRVSIKVRLVWTLVAGAMLCYVADLGISRLGLPWIDPWLASLPWLGFLIANLAIGGLPHAFNIIDGYNGLAGTVAVLIAAALMHVSMQLGDRQLAGMLAVLLGSTLGFLIWNYPHGKIFAGDGGAYLWGLVIAYGCVQLVSKYEQVSPWFPMMLLSYPVVETLFSIYRKLVRGQSPGMADALHLHQLIYRRIVRVVIDDEDEAREMLLRNNRTSPYLWGVAMLTIVPAVLFWHNTWALIACCVLFVILYVSAYLAIVRFKLPSWLG